MPLAKPLDVSGDAELADVEDASSGLVRGKRRRMQRFLCHAPHIRYCAAAVNGIHCVPMKIQCTVLLPDTDRRAASQLADAEGRSLSNMLAQLIAEALAARAEEADRRLRVEGVKARLRRQQ